MERSRIRWFASGMLTLALAATACAGSGGASPAPAAPGAAAPPPPTPGALAAVACSLPREQVVRIWRGTRLERAGDIQIVPKEPNFMDGGISHSGPWDYLQRVPMLLYGPGFIRAAGKVDRTVTMADVAPTFAELLGFDFEAPDGKAMTEALLPAAERPEPPRLIVTIVLDAGGRVVLDQWPGAWPYMRRLIARGTWYENAELGSSPSVTPPVHATLGTGVFARRHGVLDNQIRVDGKLVGSWGRGPGSLLLPTLADLYDVSMGNEPLVGAVATLAWHLGMIGHGSAWEGGDRDIAVLRVKEGDEGAEGDSWNLPEVGRSFYELPPYVNDLPPLSAYFDEADALDGEVDGTWRGHRFDAPELRGGFHTPARIPYESRLIQEIIIREGFGQDDVPDLLFTNYKLIDEVGHVYTLNSLEMKDTLRLHDRDLRAFVRFLNDEVGKGKWVLLVTADHGHTPDPDRTGAFRISVPGLEGNLTATFDDADGRKLVQKIRPTQIWLDTAELEENGFTLAQVSQFLLDYTKAQAAKPGVSVAAGDRNERVFAAAFPSSILDRLPCLPEGDGA